MEKHQLAKELNPKVDRERLNEEHFVFLVILFVILGLWYKGTILHREAPVSESEKAGFLEDKENNNPEYVVTQTSNSIANPSGTFKYGKGDLVQYLKYPGSAGWKGKISGFKNGQYEIIIEEVITRGNKIYYLFPSDCSGSKKLTNTQMNKASVGEKILIAPTCID